MRKDQKMNKFKRLTAIILSVIMMISAIPVVSSAADASSGTCGDNLTWTLDENGTLTISGEGGMNDYRSWRDSKAPWNGNDVKNVVVENGVTSIGTYAFYYCYELTSVTIPDSVTSIGDYAFFNCYSLKDAYYTGRFEEWANINIGYSNDYLTANGINIDGRLCRFCGKSVLWELDEDGTLTISGEGEITYNPWNSGDVKAVIIENGVTTIGYSVFGYCSLLTSVTIARSVTHIDSDAFTNSNAIEVVYYGGTEEEFSNLLEKGISGATVHFSDGTSRTYPRYCGENVTWMLDEDGTLTISGTGDMNSNPWNNSDIKTVIIENGVTSIGDFAFDYCTSLTSVTIPGSVTNIGTSVFESCNKLETVYFGGTEEEFSVLFEKGIEGATVYFADGTSKTYLRYCGENVTWTLDEKGTLTISGTGEITSSPWNIEDVKTLIIEDGVTSMESYAFSSCFLLTSVTIPDSVTTIGDGAFHGCSSLTLITIGKGVTNIEDSVFADCFSLKDVYYTGSKEDWDNITIGDENYYLTGADVWIDGKLQGMCGDDLEWTLTEDGMLTISGTGVMNDYISAPWYGKNVKSVVIEDGVTSIGNSAFYDCTSLTTVTMTGDVANIGSNAFENCNSIRDVYYSGTEAAFTKLFENGIEGATVHFSDGTSKTYDKYCGENATCILDENGTLTISGTGEIESSPWNKSDVKSIIIEDGITSIMDWVFWECTSLTSVTIPDSVTSIGNGAFMDCKALTEITIPDSVDMIGYNAFAHCTSLISATIPDGVKRIESAAFYNCSSLTTVTIPYNALNIGDSAFGYCTSLTDVHYSGNKADWDNIRIDGENDYLINANLCISAKNNITWALDENGMLTISGTGKMKNYDSWGDYTAPWYGKDVKSVVIENGVTGIGRYAFYDCESLTSATIPDSIASIGDSAFGGCYALKDIYYGGSKEDWNNISIGDNYYLTSVTLWIDGKRSGTCGDDLTWTLDDNGTLTISGTGAMNDYNTWGDNVAPWYGKGVKSVIIEDGVTSIGRNVFRESYGSSALTSVTIPDSITSIGDYAFENCIALKNVYYYGSIEDWGNISIGDNYYLINKAINIDGKLCRFCGKSVVWELDENGTLTISGKGEMTSYPWNRSDVKAVIIEDGVTSICGYAFNGCTALTTVTIGDSVTSIGWNTFSGCTSLTTVTIPDGVTSICSSTFYNCTSLTTITIPDGVTRIDSRAFYNCTSLVSVSIPDSVTLIGDSAFEGCTSLPNVAIPGSVTQIAYKTFASCTSLVSVDIPDGVISIGVQSFENCTSLPEVFISASVTSIADKAFAGCTSMMNINADENNSVYASVDGVVYDKELKTLILYPAGRRGEFTVPDGIESIGASAFDGCTGITAVHLPASITNISGGAFAGCGLLTDVYYLGTQDEFNNVFISGRSGLSGKNLHIEGRTEVIPDYCGEKVTWTLDDEGTLTISGEGDMYNYGGYGPDGYNHAPWSNEKVKTVVVENGVTSIGNYAFRMVRSVHETVYGASAVYGSDIISVDMPDSIKSIGYGAFSYCDSLTSIVIPDGVTSIGWSAFDCCTSLTSAAIPDGVTIIDNYTFRACTSLTSVTIPDSVITVGGAAFYNCTSLTDIYYSGTKEKWNSISIYYSNDPLENANIHYNTVLLPQYTPGDIDGDRMINTKDSNRLKQIILGKTSVIGKAFTAADIYRDGAINTKDIFMLKKMLSNG